MKQSRQFSTRFSSWIFRKHSLCVLVWGKTAYIRFLPYPTVGGSLCGTGMKYVKPLNLFRELVKLNAAERGLLLGLDVGDKYVGLAVSDRSYKIANPVSVLVRKENNIEMMATDFQNLISEYPLSAFIIGQPLHRMKNSPDAVQVKLFIDDLSDTGKLDGFRYTLYNECYTSKNIELLMKHTKIHPVLVKTISDKLAAAGILQGYLDFANRNLESDSSDSD